MGDLLYRIKLQSGDAEPNDTCGPHDARRRVRCVGIKKHVIRKDAGSRATI